MPGICEWLLSVPAVVIQSRLLLIIYAQSVVTISFSRCPELIGIFVRSPWHRKLPFAAIFRFLRAFASAVSLTRPSGKAPLYVYRYYMSYFFTKTLRFLRSVRHSSISAPVRPVRPPARSTLALHFMVAIDLVLPIRSL